MKILYIDALLIVAFNTSISSIFKMRQLCKSANTLSQSHDFIPLLAGKNADEKLMAIIKYFNYLPAQHSDEWLKQRNGDSKCAVNTHLAKLYNFTSNPPAIGGSEIASLLGSNPYSNKIDLCKTKLGMKDFNGNVCTRWGNLFENVIRKIVEIDFDCCIQETGAIPVLRNSQRKPIASYSPDGLATLAPEYINCISRGLVSTISRDLVLFEFKCPYSRIPDGVVPAHYKSQVLMGLAGLNCEHGIFCDALFRKTSMRQLMREDASHIPDERQKKESFINKACKNRGFIGLFSPLKINLKTEFLKLLNFSINATLESGKSVYLLLRNFLREHNISITKNILSDLHSFISPVFEIVSAFLDVNSPVLLGKDYGCKNLENILYNIETKNTHTWFNSEYIAFKSSINFSEWLESQTEAFNDYCWFSSVESIGFIPWKLLSVKYIHLLSEPNFLINKKQLLLETTSTIEIIKNKITNVESNKRDSFVEMHFK